MTTPASPQDTNPAVFLKSTIRTIADWPQPGVMFRDITPLFQNRKALRVLVDLFVQRYIDMRLDYVAGLDARGFMLGPLIAYGLDLGFIPIRKQGKLPARTLSQAYELEYGTATVEVHADACRAGDRVVLVDDLIATGGTMLAGLQLLRRLGAQVVEAAAIIDLPDLGGSQRLREQEVPLFTVCEFAGE